ncbi:kinase-like protein [Athelia psychrophila]|uniref:non-specific serine/threonine protein kinase n=1 Tax=Athelia psychrophila TaxID=1759441 RepID=A0A166MLW7_9AGAM|nr:kinase-like protein [Fibularhizoctonia sp. CBS 109695]
MCWKTPASHIRSWAKLEADRSGKSFRRTRVSETKWPSNKLALELLVLELASQKRQPFLTQALATFQDEDNIYFVMRLYPADLWQVVYLEGVQFTPEQFKVLACELMLGIEALHKLHVVHRDLKLDNILLTPEGHLAVADYGEAEVFPTRRLNECSFMTGIRGTYGYMAPEILEGVAYTPAVDVWGFGIILFELYTGKRCIPGDTEEEARIMNTEMPYTMHERIPVEIDDPKLAEVLAFALALNPKHRASWQDFRSFAFFADVDWEAVKSRNCPVDMFKPTMGPLAPISDSTTPIADARKCASFSEEDFFNLGDDLRLDYGHGRHGRVEAHDR